jgi:hypothetical protein
LSKKSSCHEQGHRAELRTEMANHKAEIIKWMFLSWIGQAAATAAIIKLLQYPPHSPKMLWEPRSRN